MKDDAFYNCVSNDRLATRQIDELIGLARGLCADGILNQAEVEFLQSWLAANLSITDEPILQTLWERVAGALVNGFLDEAEHANLFEALNAVGGEQIALGEVLKSSSLPLCSPAPDLTFVGRQYVFTGRFSFGQRKECERAVVERGAMTGSLTRQTDFLVVGEYVTNSWKHSSMGTKILKAVEMRANGIRIAIVSEAHWRKFL